MRTNDGYEITSGDIWVPVKKNDYEYVPHRIDMYNPIGTGRLWYYKQENCQLECDKLNKSFNQIN